MTVAVLEYRLKVIVFWNVKPYSLVDVTNILEQYALSIFLLKMETTVLNFILVNI
jgi:hypothetical protein